MAEEPKSVFVTDQILNTLQISYLMSTGRSVWIQALLYVLLGGGFFFCGFLGLMHSTGGQDKKLPKSFKFHAFFSFLVGMVGVMVFAIDIAKFFYVPLYTAYGFMTVIYMVLLVPAWVIWLGIIMAWIPAEFMKGKVVVKGPAYAELGNADLGHAEQMSVEMEENPVKNNPSYSSSEDVVTDDVIEPDVVEVDLGDD